MKPERDRYGYLFIVNRKTTTVCGITGLALLILVAIVVIGPSKIRSRINAFCCGDGDRGSMGYASSMRYALRSLDEQNANQNEPLPRTPATLVHQGLMPWASMRGARTHWYAWDERGDIGVELDWELSAQEFYSRFGQSLDAYCNYVITPTPMPEVPEGAEWVAVYMRPRPADATVIVSWVNAGTELVDVGDLEIQLGTQGLDLEWAPPKF